MKWERFWSAPGNLCLSLFAAFGAFPFSNSWFATLVRRDIVMLFDLGFIFAKLAYGCPCFPAAVSEIGCFDHVLPHLPMLFRDPEDELIAEGDGVLGEGITVVGHGVLCQELT